MPPFGMKRPRPSPPTSILAEQPSMLLWVRLSHARPSLIRRTRSMWLHDCVASAREAETNLGASGGQLSARTRTRTRTWRGCVRRLNDRCEGGIPPHFSQVRSMRTLRGKDVAVAGSVPYCSLSSLPPSSVVARPGRDHWTGP